VQCSQPPHFGTVKPRFRRRRLVADDRVVPARRRLPGAIGDSVRPHVPPFLIGMASSDAATTRSSRYGDASASPVSVIESMRQ
jgi:hypothetical protein